MSDTLTMLKEIQNSFEDSNKILSEFRVKNEELEKDKLGKGEFETFSKKAYDTFEQLEKNIKELNNKIAFTQNFTNLNKQELKEEKLKKFSEAILDMRSNFPNGTEFSNYLKSLSTEKKQFLIQTDKQISGGYYVLPEMEELRRTYFREVSSFRPLAKNKTTYSNSVEFLVKEQYSEAKIRGERTTPEKSSTTPTTKQSIALGTTYFWTEITQQDIEFAVNNPVQEALREALEAIAYKQEYCFLLGDGQNNTPYGILNYGTWTTAGTFERGKIESINSGSATTFTIDSLMSGLAQLGTRGYENNNTFIVHPKTLWNVMAKWKDKNDNYQIITDLVNGQVQRRILGYPVIPSIHMEEVGASKKAVLFGDFKQCYEIVDKSGMYMKNDTDPDDPELNRLYVSTMFGGAIINFQGIKLIKCAA